MFQSLMVTRMVIVWRLIATCVAVLPSLCDVPGAVAQDYVARSEMCVALVKRLNPATHIRTGLADNTCPLTPPPTRYSGAPRHAWLASGAECQTPLDEVPACGLASSFLDTLPGSVRRINLGNGRCLHVLPVMLTDKTEAFKCNAVKVRPACVAAVRQAGGTTIVTLASGSGASGAIRADVLIPETPQHHMPLFAKSRGGPLMALLPADVTIAGDAKDVEGYLKHAADNAMSSCEGARPHCREQAAAHVDRAMGELIRRVWNPRSLVSKEERAKDLKSLKDRILAATDLGPHAREKKLYARAIIENEVSGSSPYQMLDAVIRNSGISWGAHQIDIGANEMSEVDLFWTTLRTWRRAPGTGDYPALREADQVRQCLSQPIRNFFVEHIALYYRSLPDMNKGFRSDQGRASYDARFKAYLEEEVAPALALTGLFKKSPFAWLYYIDQRNQRGPRAGQALKAIGQALGGNDLGRCADVAMGEDRLVAHLKGVTTPGEHYDVDRRVENLKVLLQREYGDNLGRTCGG